MTSYQIDNVILAAHCILHCTVQCFSVCLDSGSGQCSRYSVGFPCFSHHRLHLSVSQYIADDTHGQFYHRTLFISVKLHPRLIPHYASYYGPL